METTTPPPATADWRTWPDPGHVLLVDPLRGEKGRMMAVQPRTLWRVPGGAAAHTTAGCTTDDPVQIGQATGFFRTPLEIEREGVMALYWRARLVAFILEWQVARVAGLGRRGRAEAQRRQAGPGRRTSCRGSGESLDGTAAAPTWIGGPPDRQDLPAS